MASSTPKNIGVLLSSFQEPLKVTTLELPRASVGSAVVKVLATYVPAYAGKVYTGEIGFKLPVPLTPGLSCVGRIHELGADAVKLKVNDLVFVDPTVVARDDEEVTFLQGHFEGGRPEGKTLMDKVWRHGGLQSFVAVPLENCVLLDEGRLCGELSYSPADLATLFTYMVAAGPLLETAKLLPGETIVIGPATGSYSGAAVEIALALGANVIALGRNEQKLVKMRESLGNPTRLQYVAMKGEEAADAAALRAALPNGADVYSDWTPTGSPNTIYLTTVGAVLKVNARVVLSGGSFTSQGLSHALMVLKNISMTGKFMYSRSTVRRVYDLLSLGLLSVGDRVGAVTRIFNLEKIDDAIKTAEAHGNWRDTIVVTPNSV